MKEINQLLMRQIIEFALLWIIAFSIIVLFETGILSEGELAGHAQLEFFLETGAIILTLLIIPFSLKQFGQKLNYIRELTLLDAIKAYRKWNTVRLLIFAIIIWGNLILYYVTLNNIGGLCALISSAAALYYLPSKKRVINELNIEEP